MPYYAYRGQSKNFGDELNHFLMPKLMGGPSTRSDNLILGIGSIIFDFHPPHLTKVVLGAGFGGYTKPPVLDDRWKVLALRGPRTARALQLDPSLAVADLAVMVSLYRDPSIQKSFKFSFMPHFESLERSDWEIACRLAGINFIDPRWEVERVLESLQQSEVLISEAMHGAIVADAFRVPWIAVLPNDPSHRPKWYDWAEALNVTVNFQPLRPASVYEWLDNVRIHKHTLRRITRPMASHLKQIAKERFLELAARDLVRVSASSPQLSRQEDLSDSVDKFGPLIDLVRREYW